jgi:uncharacterized membrane protein
MGWNRRQLHHFVRHSNVEPAELHRFYEREVYRTPSEMKAMLRLFFFVIGWGFLLVGIVFFFAFNWQDLHKFLKLGLVLSALIACLAYLVFSKATQERTQLIVSGASVLVGVLFAVYGQIYQTGANAYDFFLVWSLAILPWVLVARFAPLWLFWIVLLNTTLFFYAQQIAIFTHNSYLLLYFLALNGFFYLLSLGEIISAKWRIFPRYFTQTMGMLLYLLFSFGLMLYVFSSSLPKFFSLVFIVSILLFYALAFFYSFKVKQVVLLGLIPFSWVLRIVVGTVTDSQSASSFFISGIFLLFTLSYLTYMMFKLHNYWRNGKQ